MVKGKRILKISTLVIFFLCLTFYGLVNAKPFLAPITTAAIFALLMLPLSRKLEKNGMNRNLSSIINTLILFLVSLGFFALFSLQIKNFIQDWPQIQEAMRPKVEQLKTFAFSHTSLKKEDLNSSEGFGLPLLRKGSAGTRAANFFSGFIGFMGTYLLTFIYIFFMLNYRKRFWIFLLSLFPEENKKNVKRTIKESAQIAPAYLIGKLLLMAGLAVVYSIGLGLSGVNNFILVSVIAALFTLIPYIGNIVGLAMAMSFGYLTSGETSVLVGVAITFGVAQTIESYVLQPYIVGDKVDLHPFVIIVIVILGNLVWGTIGMILAIPVMAILTIILLHIPALENFGIFFSKKPQKRNE